MIITNNPPTEINRMFLDPNVTCPDSRRPVLYLLRRDLQNQYGKESDYPNSENLKSPLLTCLGIMAGFEILTKLWSGNHKAGTSDMEKFFISVLELSEDKAIALAQFRHALAHGYRLQTKRKKNKQTYSFMLNDSINNKECVAQINSHYSINIWRLKELFLKAIKDLKSQIEASDDMQMKFMNVKANIGEIEIHKDESTKQEEKRPIT